MALLGRLFKQLASRPARDSLLVMDSMFPNLMTAFRVAEYTHYLESLPNARVLSLADDYPQHHAAYAALHPGAAKRVQAWTPDQPLPPARLGYAVFLNGASYFQAHFEAAGMPFATTLYPGGGFGVDAPASDAKLARLFDSALMRAIIVTQPSTLDYLKARGRGDDPRIHYLYGMVVQPEYFTPLPDAMRPRHGLDKDTLDIGFVAYKYMPGGVDKGYPLFIAAAKAIARALPRARFHVVGNFGPDDAPLHGLESRLQFHGPQHTRALRALLATLDMVVSPNQARLFSGDPGKTDGFPTGSSMEASLCGAAILATDELAQNRHYADGSELIVVPPDAAVIAERVVTLAADPQVLAALGEAGRARSLALYAPGAQLGRRLAILRACMA